MEYGKENEALQVPSSLDQGSINNNDIVHGSSLSPP
jgi:hypothetical protein